MKNPFKAWLLGLVSLFSVLALTGCGWTGTGQVVEKEFEEGHWETKRKSDGTKSRTWVPDCYELEIQDERSNEVIEECFSQRVWEDAMVGHQITITKEYR